MPNEYYRSMSSFSKLNQFGGTFSNLRNTPCRCLYIIGLKGLDRVDNHNFGQEFFYLLEDILRLSFSENKAIIELMRNTVGTHFYLFFTFLSRYVERTIGQVKSYLQ